MRTALIVAAVKLTTAVIPVAVSAAQTDTVAVVGHESAPGGQSAILQALSPLQLSGTILGLFDALEQDERAATDPVRSQFEFAINIDLEWQLSPHVHGVAQLQSGTGGGHPTGLKPLLVRRSGPVRGGLLRYRWPVGLGRGVGVSGADGGGGGRSLRRNPPGRVPSPGGHARAGRRADGLTGNPRSGRAIFFSGQHHIQHECAQPTSDQPRPEECAHPIRHALQYVGP